MPPTTPSLDKQIDDLLVLCSLWGNNWESWLPEEMEHYTANFKHSPNFKEVKAALTALVEQETDKAELYGRLHLTIELFKTGALSVQNYLIHHSKVTDRIAHLTNTNRKDTND